MWVAVGLLPFLAGFGHMAYNWGNDWGAVFSGFLGVALGVALAMINLWAPLVGWVGGWWPW